MTQRITASTSGLGLPEGGLDYEAALKRVMGLPDFERSTRSPGHSGFHLERMALLMARLGSPDLGIPTVHVAGTKGKGSTAAMVASILSADGYKVGLYTSPHLHRVVERIRVGLEPIGGEEFGALVERAWPAVEWVERHGDHGPVTFFELLTSMAFLHFSQIAADFQVIEVGLGGRLDATNVVSPEVCTITSISLDHTATLGATLALIAAEKAGIIKPGVPVVVAPQPAEALEVFLKVSAAREAPIVQVHKELTWRKRHSDLNGQSADIAGLRGRYHLRMPLLGDHQVENAATAVATVETLSERGFVITSGGIVEGLRRVRWPARLEVMSCEDRQVIVDGAHNPHSMRRLAEAIRQNFPFRRVILIFGATGGHSARGMAAEVAGLSPAVIPVRSRHPKAAPVDEIASAARAHGLEVVLGPERVGDAARRALDIAAAEDLVLAAGSLSVAAEVIEELRGLTPELYPALKPPPLPGTTVRRS